MTMNNEIKTSEDFREGILREQIRLVMEQVPTMQIVSFIVALVLVYIVRDIVAPANILVWVLLVLLIVCSRIVFYYRFCKVREESFDGQYWKNLYLTLALISGIIWGASAFIIFPAGNLSLICLFLLVMASLSAATTVSHSSIKLGPTAWVGPALLPYAIRCLAEGGESGYALSFLITLYMFGILRHSFIYNKSIASAITLRFENLELLAELRKVNDILRQDIIKQMQTEQAMKESEERFEALAQSTFEGIAFTDGGIVIDANSQLAQMLGYDLSEIIGKPIADLVAPEDWEFVRQIMENGYEGLFESRLLHKDRSILVVESQARHFAYRGRNVVVTVVRDITDRNRAAEALRREERLALAMKATQDAVWDWDLIANTLYYSPHWWRMVGYKENELEADPGLWRRLMHPEDLERAGRIISEAIIGETSFEVETRLAHKAGHYVPILIRGYILRDESGKAVRISGTNTDLTEKKRTEEENRLWEQQLNQLRKAESLGRMAGAVAHLFNNHLTVVIGNLELALTGSSGDSAIREKLIEAMGAALRSAEISGLMLTYLGQSTAGRELLDLSEVCRQILPTIQDAMPESVALKTDLLSSSPLVLAHAGQIQQVLTHLITNGWESIGHGTGTVTLKTMIIQALEILKFHLVPVGWKPTADAFSCLEVTDTGCGMAEEDLEKIFDPFYTTKFTGRGLGLAVVLGIVKTWGGAIGVESRKNRGSIFRVFLPLVADELPLASENGVHAHRMEPGGTVLLVEDQDAVRNMAESMLEHIGYKVLAASSGVEAIDLLRANPDLVHCVITDLSMPGMDGWETLAALRKILPHIPVILVSGHDEALAMTGDWSERPRFSYTNHTR